MNGKLDYTWSSPTCGDRNGALSYDYEFGESGEEDVQRENLIVTSKSFEDLKHYVMYEFTVLSENSRWTGSLHLHSDQNTTKR